MVALAEALSHPCYAVRRLLDMAEGWERGPSQSPCLRTPLEPTYRKVRPAVVDELVVRYQEGAMMRELAAEFGIAAKPSASTYDGEASTPPAWLTARRPANCCRAVPEGLDVGSDSREIQQLSAHCANPPHRSRCRDAG
jgi:hypothetical protein